MMSSSDAPTEPDRSAPAAEGVHVLGIEVPSALVETWHRWWAPALQPFPVDDPALGTEFRRPFRDVSPSPEVRDTFFLYGGDWEWWYEEEFRSLPVVVRRRLSASRRRRTAPKPSPPWPSTTSPRDDAPLIRWVEAGAARSRHDEVPDEVWRRAEGVLPRARALVKPSQPWSSPRLVQPVRELILSWRFPGTRLERHRLHDRSADRPGTTPPPAAPSGSTR